jgi:hypothetical protein
MNNNGASLLTNETRRVIIEEEIKRLDGTIFLLETRGKAWGRVGNEQKQAQVAEELTEWIQYKTALQEQMAALEPSATIPAE